MTLTGPPRRETTGTTPLAVHVGRALQTFANHYPTIPDVVYELVQNSIDAKATQVRIRIDYRRGEGRTITVTDNGTGATPAMVGEALTSIGETIKTGSDTYGEFGQGFVSPMGKCGQFTFTTKHESEDDRAYRTWTFNSDIMKIKLLSEIIWKSESNLVFAPDETLTLPTKLRSFVKVPWRTRIKMTGVTTDKRVSSVDLDELVTEIARRFREKIIERSIDITVRMWPETGERELTRTVSAERFHGKPLDVHTVKDEKAGTTEFTLFLALKGADGRKGKVEFSTRTQKGLRQKITAEQFFRCVNGCGIPIRDDVKKAIVSGVFEGDVLAERVELNPDRASFKNNDTLWGLCSSLEKWFDEVGTRHYEKVLRENREVRYSRIGEEVLSFLTHLFKSTPSLMESLAHLMPNGVTVPGLKEREPRKPPVDKPDAPEPTPVDKPDKPPRKPRGKSVGGSKPRGGIGLRFEFVEFEMTRQPYELDLPEGVLYFNTIHQFWSYCDTTDARLRQYQTVVVQVALIEARYGGTGGPMIHHCLYDLLRMQVLNIVNNNVLIGVPGSAMRELTFDA